jgi:hypothetical protein
MRKLLAILLCAGLLAVGAASNEAAARDGVYRSVAIDTSRIAMRGHAHLAASLKPMLAGELSKALGPRLGNRGGRLVVRITSIRMIPNAGDAHADAAGSDRLEAVVIVPGRGALPVRIQLPPSLAGAWYAQNNDERRVFRLIEALAQWTARAV